MRIHFFTAPFLLCFHLVQGSGFKVQGSRGGFAVFLEDGILVSQPSPLGNAIKLRKSLAAQRLASPFGGSAEGNRGMPAAIEQCWIYRSAAPSSHFVRNGVSLDFSVATLLKIQFACTYCLRHFPRRGKPDVAQLTISLT